jgi:hypothetical protein
MFAITSILITNMGHRNNLRASSYTCHRRHREADHNQGRLRAVSWGTAGGATTGAQAVRAHQYIYVCSRYIYMDIIIKY